MNTLEIVRAYSLLLLRYCIVTIFFRIMAWFASRTSWKLTFDFQLVLLFLSWNKNIESADIYKLYKRHAFTIPVSYDRNKDFTMNYSRWCLSLCKFLSRKIKSQFLWWFWGGPRYLVKNTVEMQYLGSNKL